MTTRSQQARYATDLQSPATLLPGQVGVQLQGIQLFVGDAGGNAKPVVPVRFFNINTSYLQNDLVAISGTIYRAKSNLAPGAWDGADWESVTSVELPVGLVYEYDAGVVYGADDIVTWQGGVYRANGAITGDPDAQPAEWSRIDTDGLVITELPADAAGALVNDGAGILTWEAILPSSAVGFLYDDGAGNRSWASPLPASAEGFLYDDGAGVRSWEDPNPFPAGFGANAPNNQNNGGFLWSDGGSPSTYAWQQGIREHHRNFILNPNFEIWNSAVRQYTQDEADPVKRLCARWFVNRRLGATAGATYDIMVDQYEPDATIYAGAPTQWDAFQARTLLGILINELVNIGGSVFPNDAGIWLTQRIGVYSHMIDRPLSLSFVAAASITHNISAVLSLSSDSDSGVLYRHEQVFQVSPAFTKYAFQIPAISVPYQVRGKIKAELSFYLQLGTAEAANLSLTAIAGATGWHYFSEVRLENTPRATRQWAPPDFEEAPRIARYEYALHNEPGESNTICHTGVALSDSNARVFIPFPMPMAATPNMEYSALADFSIMRSQGASEDVPSSITLHTANSIGAAVNFTYPAATFNAGEPVFLKLTTEAARLLFKVPYL